MWSATTERTPLAGILGALIGDALGVPFEFKNAADIPVRGLEMVMPVNFQKTYPHIKYGTLSDDSAQSGYPVVFIPISTQHYMMLKRNLIYTGITRGKRLVVLVGQKRALAMAVKGKQVERRWSKLKERLTVMRVQCST